MASGTTKVTQNQSAWVRVDDDAAYVSGKIEAGSSVLVCYVEGDSSPALNADAGTFEPGEQFNFAMGTADSLWIRSTSGPCRVTIFKRAV